MIHLSPEMSVDQDVRIVSATSEAGRQTLDPDLLILLARLNCLSCLTESPHQLMERFTATVREVLVFSLSSFLERPQWQLWFGFVSFQKTLRKRMDDFSRDVLLSRYVLSQTSLDSLLDPHTSWFQLYGNCHQRLVDAVGRLNQDGDLRRSFESIYKEQRALLLKEVLMRALPALVLWASTLVAIIMAVLVWRSLISGS